MAKKKTENKKKTVAEKSVNESQETKLSGSQGAKVQPAKTEWFEKEDFWNNYAPIMFDAARWAEAPAVAESVCKIAGLGKGAKILDAGCGPGRIAVELASLGLEVTGVDLIQSELDAAAESASAEGVDLELIKADLRSFKSEKKFDCAINLFTSFGYCDTIEEDVQILKSIFNSVRDGGFFILENLSREIAIKDFTEGEWFERAGKTVLTDFSVVGAWEGLRSRWILIDNESGERIEHEFIQRLYSAIELKRIMIGIGFKSVEIYGDFDFSPYNQNARTMVIVARK
ncbi:MAG: class I SAM-dependent methyltransferase [Treponema sp.]|nr:class I SAM-dependent methyltransferase [Treponema sp.]